ncbi:MAG: twin-arginine translocase TatA/TatE family subunit [Alphaproteobacteria bacterium]|nr:twin-arginine translocase TatA/TatE family subunit [Alphaproteobacteria bacterium]
MGTFSIWHWVIILAVVLLLFGAGKIPRLMGDLAKGITAFKKGLKEELPGDSEAPKPIEAAAKEKDAAST